MAYDFDGSTQYISAPLTAIQGYPCTLACWFNSDDATALQTLLAVLDTGSANVTGFSLDAQGAGAGDPVRTRAWEASASVTALSTTGYTVGQWHHACGVHASATSHDAYIDGGSKGSVATSRTVSAILDGVSIGGELTSAFAKGTNGRVAEAGVWSAALTDAEVASLARGVSPLKIRPQSLVFYSPLIRELVDRRGGLVLTATAAPTVAAHPRVYGL